MNKQDYIDALEWASHHEMKELKPFVDVLDFNVPDDDIREAIKQALKDNKEK